MANQKFLNRAGEALRASRANHAEKAEKTEKTGMLAPQKLKLLFTVVNRGKTEFYADLLQSFGVNMQMLLSAHGTASAETLHYLGLPDAEKGVLISVIRADREKEALATLEEKFRTIRNGKGIAYTVPMASTIGVAIYQFLSGQM